MAIAQMWMLDLMINKLIYQNSKRMKKIISLLAFIALLVTNVSPIQAQRQTTSTSSSQVQSQRQADRLPQLKARADQEIDRRIATLNRLITRLTTIKRLSAPDKSSLTSQIQAQITSLTQLKTKIDADTDITTLRADVQSIVTSYRIFLLFIPKIHLLAGADALADTSDKFASYTAELKTRIAKAQANGRDVTSLQTTLTDMETKIADAKTQAQTITSEILPLTPEGYPGNKTTLESARESLRKGREDLLLARQDAATILKALRTAPSPTHSATLP